MRPAHLFAAAGLALTALPTPASAWGLEGHEIVAAIARARWPPSARRGAVAAAPFHWSLPVSRRHVPVQATSLRARLHGFATALRDPSLPWLFAGGGLVMGAFVTVYNYLAFRLIAPPYRLASRPCRRCSRFTWSGSSPVPC